MLVTLYVPVVPVHTLADPLIADVAGVALMVTARFTGAPGQLAVLVSTTLTLPGPDVPQSTVMLFEVLPEAWLPPVIVQA